MDSDKAPFDPTRLDDINSLETARMALRWALERLATLERLGAEYMKKAEWEFRMRLKAEEDFKSQLDLERAHAEDAARLRAKQSAKSFAEKVSAIEAEHAAALTAAREKAEEAASRVEVEIVQARMRLEAEFTARLTDIRLSEDRLRGREADLSERENEFERFCFAQKRQAEAELRRIEKQAWDETSRQVEAVRRSGEKEFRALQEAWLSEKSFLEREIGEWKAKASGAGGPAKRVGEEVVEGRQTGDRERRDLGAFEDPASHGRALSELSASWREERELLKAERQEAKDRLDAAQRKCADQEKDLGARDRELREYAKDLAEREERSRQALRERETALDRREEALKEGNTNLLRHYRGKRARLEKLKAQAERELSDIARRINENPGEKPPRGKTDRPGR